MNIIKGFFTCGSEDILCWVCYVIAGTFFATIHKMKMGEPYFSASIFFIENGSISIYTKMFDLIINIFFALAFVTKVYFVNGMPINEWHTFLGGALSVYSLSLLGKKIEKEA
jgi:hypothetical protein